MTRAWMGAAAAAGVVGVLTLVFACSSSSTPPPPVANGGQCTTGPGKFPAPNCLPFDPSTAATCAAPTGKCDVAPCTKTSACLAMSDNTGSSVANLRMRKLLVTAPPALAFAPPSHIFVQRTVIDEGINLDNQCGEPGTGTFNWLIQFDTASKKLTTGCAPPATDPFGAGYCFVNTMINGLQVTPVTVTLTQNADGSYSSGLIPKLYVPIFVAASVQGAGAAPSVIILPLTNSAVHNVTLSDSGNCIGHYNASAVTPQGSTCIDTDPASCVRWTTAGSLGGYITLQEADGVDVPQLSESLCVLLDATAPIDTSDPNEKRCMKDSSGKVMAKGDYCSTTNAPGGCADSAWMAATFAASAAKISATPNEPTCMGAGIGGDAGGGDSAAPSDAGGQ